MNIPSKIQHLSSFEIEKLCHLLECDQQELVEFEKLALQIAHETENNISFVFVLFGNANENKLLAVVYLPGIATKD